MASNYNMTLFVREKILVFAKFIVGIINTLGTVIAINRRVLLLPAF